MSLWQKLFNTQQDNIHKNNIACVESDCSCLSEEQLIDMLRDATDEDTIKGIKKILNARGYSKKELENIQQPILS